MLEICVLEIDVLFFTHIPLNRDVHVTCFRVVLS